MTLTTKKGSDRITLAITIPKAIDLMIQSVNTSLIHLITRITCQYVMNYENSNQIIAIISVIYA